MNNQIEQYMAPRAQAPSRAVALAPARRPRWLFAWSLLFLLMGFAPTVAAYNIALTSVSTDRPWKNSDGSASGASDSNNVPVGGIAVYEVVIENLDGAAAAGMGAVFDVPAGMSIASMPNYCSLAAGSSTRVQCQLPTIAGGKNLQFPIELHSTGMPVGAVNLDVAVGSASQFPPVSTPVKDLSFAAGSVDPFFAGDSTLGNNKQSATVTLDDSADLSLSKTADTTAVIGGGYVTYTMTVTNNGPSGATSFKVVDTLPGGFSVKSGSFVSVTPGWTWDEATRTATHAGTLPHPGVATFRFQAKADVPAGNVTNSALVTAVGTADTNPTNNFDNVDTLVTPGADLLVTPSWSATPVAAGSEVDLDIKVVNAGPVNADDVTMTGKLPPGATFDSFVLPPNWSCVPPDSNGTFTCTRTGSMPVGATGETIKVKTHAPGAGGNYPGEATVGSSTADPDLTNNTKSAPLTVLAAGADLSMAKSKVAVEPGLGVGGVVVPVGGKMRSTMTLTNRGPAAVTGDAFIVDTLALGEEFDPGSETGDFTCTATSWSALARQVVTCTLKPTAYNIALNATRSVTITTTARAVGVGANGALINEVCATTTPTTDAGVNKDNVPGNNCDSAGAGIPVTQNSANLKVSKVAAAPVAGDHVVSVSDTEMSYTITVTNTGAATTGVVIDDPIPGWSSGHTKAEFTASAGWNAQLCTMSGSTVRCNFGATLLASNASMTLTVKLSNTAAGKPGFLKDSVGSTAACPNAPSAPMGTHWFCNKVGVGVDGAVPGALGESDWTDNYGQDWVSVEQYADVETVHKKIVSSANGAVGQLTEYSIQYKNNGPSAVPDITARDTFTLQAGEPGFVLVSASLSGGTVCDTITRDPGITATAGGGGTSYANPTGADLTMTIACPAFTLSAGAVQDFNIAIRPNYGSLPNAAPRQINNKATFAIAQGNNGPGYVFNADLTNDEKTASLPFTAGSADMSITKLDIFDGFKSDPVAYDADNPNSNLITYKISATNGGPSVATAVKIADALTPPEGKTVTFIGGSTTLNGSYNSALCTVGSSGSTVIGNAAGTAQLQVECTMPGAGFAGNEKDGVVNNKATSVIYLRYRYDTNPEAGGDSVSNMVSVSAAEPDPQQGNNQLAEPQTTTILMKVDLGIAKTMVTTAPATDPYDSSLAPVSVVSLQEDFWYVLTATNNGSGQSLSLDRSKASNGPGTRVVDVLPDNVVVTGTITWTKKGPAVPGMSTEPNGNGTCTVVLNQGKREVTCDVGDLTYSATEKGKVRVLIPARWESMPAGGNAPIASSSNHAAVNTEQIDTNPNNNAVDVPLDVTGVTLSGYVFVDTANGASDGIRQPAETLINGVNMVLTGRDRRNNPVNLTATTVSGHYQFANLAPSDAAGYTVVQKKVANYSNGLVDPPDSNTNPEAATFNPETYLAAEDSRYVANVGPTVAVQGGGTIGTKGAIGINYNFPKVVAVTLSGHVYADIVRDDVFAAGDAPIANAKVELLDASGAKLDEATTDPNGYYAFAELHPGLEYGLREPRPSGYEDLVSAINPGKIGTAVCVTCVASLEGTDVSLIKGIRLATGNGTDFNFGEGQTTALAGVVYVDRDDPLGTLVFDGNGVFDGTDRGLPDVTIELYHGGTRVATTTTSSTGTYEFTTLANGSKVIAGEVYEVRQIQPTYVRSGKEATGNTITTVPVPVTGLSALNFGEIAGSISGRVYLDAANDDVYATTDADLDGVQLSLGGATNVFGDPVAVQVSAAGTYVFRDLPNGSFTVTQQAAQPVYGGVTTLNGATNAGTTVSAGSSAGTATGKKVTPSAVSGIALAAGGYAKENNFGEILPVSVAGAVYLDIDNDGVMDSGEVGLDDVLVQLTGVDDTGASVTITDVLPVKTANGGKFLFEGLRPGTYTVTEPTQPVGTANGITTSGTVAGASSGTGTAVTTLPSAIAGIDLRLPGSASINNLFGELPRNSSISGFVWLDSNSDGLKDAGENGLAGVEIQLQGIGIDGQPVAGLQPTHTSHDGSYLFADLPPGTYTVTEPTQPAKTLNGTTVRGSTGGSATAVTVVPSAISAIPLGVNEHSVENNFGEIQVGSIAGYVYNDSNDDGIKQGDEGGYALVDVVLTGTDDLGNAVNLPGKTDAQGHYVFDNLRPGTYTVTEPTQPPETLNGLTTAGSIDGVKSGARVTGKDTVPSMIDGIVLKPGNNSVDNNFGEIGDSPDMLVSKSSGTVKFTVNNVATYTIRVRNGGQQASTGEYIVKDRLPAGLNLAEVPSGNGWTCSGAVGDARFECRSSEVVNAGATSTSDITVKVNVTAEAAQAGTVNNAVLVEGGGENEFRTPTTTERNTFEGDVTQLPVCDAAITQNVCRVPNEVQLSASVGGTVWYDIGSDDAFLDSGDTRLQSWIVELLDAATGQVAKTTTTAVDGSYRFGDVVPGIKWNIQFRDPASGVLWAWPVNQETAGGMGVSCDATRAISDGSSSACRITENGTSQLQVVLEAGQHLPQQSLPVDPSGVVYDAITRDPVPGSIVTLSPVGVCNGYDPKTAILNAGAGGYRVEGNAVSMTVGTSGYYQFMFGPAAPARCEFQLTVTPPGGYQFVSSLIPPQEGSLSPLGAAGTSHLVQPQADAPTGAVGTPTQYWLTVFAGSATAGIVHNHLPLDTSAGTGLVITKTGDRQTAEIGDTVQYSITVRQTSGSAMATVNIVDTLPRGFTYIDGTARVGGRALDEPFGKPGPRLGFNLGPINVGQQLVLTYRVRVGVGAQQGDGINRAQAHGCSITGGCIDPGSMTPVPGSVPSNQAQYRVRVTGGVFTEEACVLGKVFVDCNNNHVQDNEELGIPGVRLYFSNGTWVISDSEGKYSYCGLTPQSHTLKVDPSTLPAGSRLTTSSNRNLGDADSLFLDLKNGELHRADFIEGSCSNPLLEQVKARRTQGEVRAPETEAGQSPLRFESKPARAPQQATDSANQRPIVHPRPNPPSASASQEVQP